MVGAKYTSLHHWLPPPKHRCSWAWRAIQAMKSGLIRLIKSDNNTSILKDPWIYHIPLNIMHTYINFNYDLVDLNISFLLFECQWNMPIIYDNFSRVTADMIIAINLPMIPL